jgi:hypothetical protein
MFEIARTVPARSNFLISVISGSTALISSSSDGQLEVARFLVERRADMAARDK